MYQAPNNSSTGGVHQPPSNQMPSPGANAPTSMPAPAEHVSVGSGGTPVMMVAPSYNQPPQPAPTPAFAPIPTPFKSTSSNGEIPQEAPTPMTVSSSVSYCSPATTMNYFPNESQSGQYPPTPVNYPPPSGVYPQMPVQYPPVPMQQPYDAYPNPYNQPPNQYMPVPNQYNLPPNQYLPPTSPYNQGQGYPNQPMQPQQQIQCVKCHILLHPPQGAEIFRCPCGQVLRNPFVIKSTPVATQTTAMGNQPPSRTMTKEEVLKKKRKQDMTDAGIGIGAAIAGAAILGSIFSHR